MKIKHRKLAPLLLVCALLSFAATSWAFYDPGQQRWINRDPLGEPGGANLYTIVFNNPVALVDAFGLAPRIPPFIIWPPRIKGNCDSYEQSLCEKECKDRGKVATGCQHKDSWLLVYRRVFIIGVGWKIEEQWIKSSWAECECTDPRSVPPPDPPCTSRNWPPPLPPYSGS